MIRLGVFGAVRGMTAVELCLQYPEAQLVAVCDRNERALQNCLDYVRKLGAEPPAAYSEFDAFIEHDMDAVVLANYATEHAPYAIRCFEHGKHVLSEVVPVQTLKEAVELVEAQERYGRVYGYAENYCYMPAPTELRRLYRSGELGDFRYAEGEYVHACYTGWDSITYGVRDHWRNRAYATFYCTHSIGPILHATGLRPVSVVGFELPLEQRFIDVGCRGGLGSAGIEMITLENGAVLKSLHGCGLVREPASVWFSIYGSKACAESDRWGKTFKKLTLYRDGAEDTEEYTPKPTIAGELAANGGHGGGDFYTLYYFLEKILGKPDGENCIGLYEALDMFLPGLMAYKSILAGNARMEVPNLRCRADREKYRGDTFCTDRRVGGEMYVPPYSKGEIDVPDEVYAAVKAKFERSLEKK